MNVYESTQREANIRWWITGPGEDESLRSVVERADRLYGGEADELRRRLWPRATSSAESMLELDMLSPRELCVLARRIGVTPRSLYSHRLPDHPMLLMETQRRAFCPTCWHEARRANRPSTFRRAWAGVFTLNCSKHGLPLHWASPPVARTGCIGTVYSGPPRTARGRRILMLIEHFAQTMERALRDHSAWPNEWLGNPYAARALLMRCVVNLGRMLEHPPFASVAGPPELASFVATPRQRVEPLQESPWKSIRALGPPAWRRAAFWMTARYVMPSLKDDELPERLPADAFAALDAQWADQSDHRLQRRVQNYRAALRTMCLPFRIGDD
jgi:hypothetical protein